MPAWYEVRTTSTYSGVRAIGILMRDASFLRACSPLRCGAPLWGLHCRWKIYMMRVSELPRPSPERLLLQVQAEENKRWGARLKIFLGYICGFGRSAGGAKRQSALTTI